MNDIIFRVDREFKIRRKILWILRYRSIGLAYDDFWYKVLHPYGTFREDEVHRIVGTMVEQNIIAFKDDGKVYKA